VLGRLRSADGASVVRIEDRYDTDIDDLWSALTDPRRLARWYGEVDGDLRRGGQFTVYVHTAGLHGVGRVEVCEPPRRLQVVTRETDESWQQGGGVPPFDQTLEATLTADGAQTILVIETHGMPWTRSPSTGPGGRSTPKTWPPTSPGANRATPRRAGTSSSLPINSWQQPSASTAAASRSERKGHSAAMWGRQVPTVGACRITRPGHTPYGC
jgi:uncharacterized protein YndB with AHSA1/START domain